MTYKLKFHELALKEWGKLDPSLKEQFKKILARRLEDPHVPSAKLHGMPGCYKIKLKSLGYRIVYQVQDDTVTIFVLAVGKREGNRAYQEATKRLL